VDKVIVNINKEGVGYHDFIHSILPITCLIPPPPSCLVMVNINKEEVGILNRLWRECCG
jgi:hypothetical protein